MRYRVLVLNHYGVWVTDSGEKSLTRALDRGRFLTPRVPAVRVERDRTGQRMDL